MITIFTPTYNRAALLKRLYQSLQQQTGQEFTWLIVDDGSTDNTRETVEQWKKESRIEIQYIWQENQGKSQAHNIGVEYTKTELFTCVDSDDQLTPNAVETILKCWNQITDSGIIGILAQKCTKDGTCLTGCDKNKQMCGTLKKLYDTKVVTGDAMLIYRSDIIKRYQFPKLGKEKFVPEAYLYDLLDQEGTLCVINDKLYVAEYQENGYSNNMARLIVNNSQGYIAYIRQRLGFDTSIKEKIEDSVRYTAICMAVREKKIISKAPYKTFALLSYPLGYLFYIRRYKKLK